MTNVMLVLQAIEAAARLIAEYSALVGEAQRQGRDLTDAELAGLKAARKAEADEFLAR